MFTEITHKNYKTNKVLIDPLLKTLKNNPILDCCFQDYSNGTYIITQNLAEGISGGAILLKQDLSSLHNKVQRGIANFISKEGEAWICTVFFHEEKKYTHRNFEASSKIFYKELYKKLIDFGAKEKTTYLCVILEPGEHLCTEIVGFWPYVIEITPSESLDGLFHGILSLALPPKKTNMKAWEKTIFHGKKLAA